MESEKKSQLLQSCYQRIWDSSIENGHPKEIENAGGTQFSVHYCPKRKKVIKQGKSSPTTISSLEICQQKLGPLVAKFDYTTTETSIRIEQEYCFGLHKVLRFLVAEGNLELAKEIIIKFWENLRNSFHLGVANIDPKVENYGLSASGEVVLLDIGMVETNQDFLDSAATGADDNSASFFYFKLHESLQKHIPLELKEFFEASGKDFLSTTQLLSTVESVTNRVRNTT